MDKPRLLDQVRDALQIRHYSLRTEANWLPQERGDHLIRTTRALKAEPFFHGYSEAQYC